MPFQPTFSLRNLLESSLKIPGKVKKFQAFSLSNMKTVGAVSGLFQHSSTMKMSSENYTFQCSKCNLAFEDWHQMITHTFQQSGTFAKHLSKMLDQSLVMLHTDQNVTSVATVLKCRKCKFYLPHHDLDQVLKHAKACNEASKQGRAGPSEGACALCGSRTHSAPSDQFCASVLEASLALSCNPPLAAANQKSCLECKNMAVNYPPLDDHSNDKFPFCKQHLSSKEKFVKLMKCFATITDAFHQSDDSIEELIVASKQHHKKQNQS